MHNMSCIVNLSSGLEYDLPCFKVQTHNKTTATVRHVTVDADAR
jgi:hypothetical protein